MQKQKFRTGDIAYLVEANRYIREGKIGCVNAGLYVYQFIEGGTILVKEHRLYGSEEEAQAYLDQYRQRTRSWRPCQ